MTDIVITKEVTENGKTESGFMTQGKKLYATAREHPIVTGSVLLVGAGLAYAAVKTLRSAAGSIAREVHVESSILISKRPEDLYRYWRDFRHLPLFMKNLESVNSHDSTRSHWVAKSPNGTTVEWDAEIFNEKQNELIAWRSTGEADIVNAGTVRFQKAPGERGTYVRVTMNYNPPGGKVGASLAQLFSTEPSQMIKEDLRRFKQLMETGEIATISGQSSGRAEQAEPISKTK